MKNYRVLGKCKPLCYVSQHRLLYFKKWSIWLGDDRGRMCRKICTVPADHLRKLLSFFRIFERAYSLDAITGIMTDEDNCVILYHHVLYRICISKGTIERIQHPYERLNVLHLSVSNGTVFFGDYKYNPSRKSMSVYRLPHDAMQTERVYRFPEGEINHIHAVIPDEKHNRLWIMTGDFGISSAIYLMDMSFSSMRRMIGNTQAARGCVGVPVEDGLIYATDSPIEKNYLMKLTIKSDGNVCIHSIAPINGSCIYGNYDGRNTMIFSTTVENQPNEQNNRKNMYRYNLGHGIKDWNTYVMCFTVDGGELITLTKIKKDILPMLPFLYGCVIIPNNLPAEADFILYGQAIKGVDGKCFLIDRKMINKENEGTAK